jgi:DNA helicase-2/ATP-dependent DNA helicase PcrA
VVNLPAGQGPMRGALTSGPGRADALLVGCDTQQVEAITTVARPLSVLAGAGSGKTRVLTRRIAWRVLDGSALGSHVLALTFTRKAAAELRGRLVALGLPEGVAAGTFHAIALAELRRLAAERRQAPPVVLSSKARLLHAVMSELPRTTSFSTRGPGPRARSTRTVGASSHEVPIHEVASEIEWAKSRLVTPSEYERLASLAGREPPLALSDVARLYESYEFERKRRRVLDFEDLLTVCASELASDAESAASAHWRFRHVFVDEYQDVNAAQLTLLKAWCAGNDDLCVVGDPDQAIYGWNGSDPEAILNFAEHFPGATVLRLRTNYRSTGEVLSIAAAVLDRSEAPPAGGPAPEGPVPTVAAYETDIDEAKGVVDLARLAHRPGRIWSQMAVLARTNAQLLGFRNAFELAGVPCRVVGDAGFLRRPHVAAALSDLQKASTAPALAAVAEDLRSAARELESHGAREDELPASPTEIEDLAELADLVDDYLRTDAVASGAGFRAFIETTMRSGDNGRSSDAVELITFHRAKGLEWPVVFVTGLEDGLVPIAHARDAAAIAEERRLLYVACTRAEEELHCSWARERRFSRERASRREPSPYLASIERARRRMLDLSVRSATTARDALAASRRALT